MAETEQQLHPYDVVMQIGKVKKTLRVVAADEEDAKARALARYQVLSAKRVDGGSAPGAEGREEQQ